MDNICHDHKLLEESTLTAAEAYLTFSMERERRNWQDRQEGFVGEAKSKWQNVTFKLVVDVIENLTTLMRE